MRIDVYHHTNDDRAEAVLSLLTEVLNRSNAIMTTVDDILAAQQAGRAAAIAEAAEVSARPGHGP